MNEPATSISLSGPLRLALLHLLAIGVDVGVLGVALAMAWLTGLRFGTVPNVAVATLGAALGVISVAAIWLALGPLDPLGPVVRRTIGGPSGALHGDDAAGAKRRQWRRRHGSVHRRDG